MEPIRNIFIADGVINIALPAPEVTKGKVTRHPVVEPQRYEGSEEQKAWKFAARLERQIVEWVLEHDGFFQLYIERPDFEPDDTWDGTAPGLEGGMIHLIASTDSDSTYAETTDDMEKADYLVSEMCILQPGTMRAMIIDLLDRAFGGQEQWPDNYAQTRGWRI